MPCLETQQRHPERCPKPQHLLPPSLRRRHAAFHSRARAIVALRGATHCGGTSSPGSRPPRWHRLLASRRRPPPLRMHRRLGPSPPCLPNPPSSPCCPCNPCWQRSQRPLRPLRWWHHGRRRTMCGRLSVTIVGARSRPGCSKPSVERCSTTNGQMGANGRMGMRYEMLGPLLVARHLQDIAGATRCDTRPCASKTSATPATSLCTREGTSTPRPVARRGASADPHCTPLRRACRANAA
mmetsp:Transcript_38620/g.111034  ORF Transcript_38620/g.111034 Transcript_38620/m.111034 type:complete len:239 (+) Transcript_38620:1193-1909(+)